MPGQLHTTAADLELQQVPRTPKPGNAGGLHAVLGLVAPAVPMAVAHGLDQAGIWRAKADWDSAVAAAAAGVDQIEAGIVDLFKDRSDVQARVTAALANLQGVKTRLNDAGLASVQQLLSTTDPPARKTLRGKAILTIGTVRNYLETDRLASKLDGNYFGRIFAVMRSLRAQLDEFAVAFT